MAVTANSCHSAGARQNDNTPDPGSQPPVPKHLARAWNPTPPGCWRWSCHLRLHNCWTRGATRTSGVRAPFVDGGLPDRARAQSLWPLPRQRPDQRTAGGILPRHRRHLVAIPARLAEPSGPGAGRTGPGQDRQTARPSPMPRASSVRLGTSSCATCARTSVPAWTATKYSSA